MSAGKSKNQSGFTLVELIVVITLMAIIFGMGATALGDFSANQNLRVSGERLIQTIKEARVNSVAQYRDSSWGVYFDVTTTPDRYVLYKGDSYLGRDVVFDRITELTRGVTLQNILLNGGGTHIRFGKRSGYTDEYGSLALGTSNDSYNITVNALGFADYSF